MSKSSRCPRARTPARPPKPYPEFPLTLHVSGAWMKKIGGKIFYFGKWGRRVDGKLVRAEGDGWKEALAEYQAQVDAIHQTGKKQDDRLTVGDLCNRFLTAKTRKVEAGEMGRQSFDDYKLVTDMMVAAFGACRVADALGPDDFARLRERVVRRWGPVRLANSTTRVKSVFKFGVENGHIDKAVRFGSEFKKPDAAALRRHKAKSGERMLEPGQLRTIIDAAPHPLKAMILLGLNGGLGNFDCASLPMSAVNLETGWLNYPCPKTGIGRRCPLWPETVAAVRVALAQRPEPADYESCGLVFLTAIGTPWVRPPASYRSDHLTKRFIELLQKLHRKAVRLLHAPACVPVRRRRRPGRAGR